MPQEAWRWHSGDGDGRLTAKISDEASVISCLLALGFSYSASLPLILSPSEGLQVWWQPGVPHPPVRAADGSVAVWMWLPVRSEKRLLWQRGSSSGRVCLWSLGVKSFWAPSFSSAWPERRTDVQSSPATSKILNLFFFSLSVRTVNFDLSVCFTAIPSNNLTTERQNEGWEP